MRSFLTSKNNSFLSFSVLPSNLTTSASSVLLARINHQPWVFLTLKPSNVIMSLELYFLKTVLDILSIVENLILSEQKGNYIAYFARGKDKNSDGYLHLTITPT